MVIASGRRGMLGWDVQGIQLWDRRTRGKDKAKTDENVLIWDSRCLGQVRIVLTSRQLLKILP
jgi:hypothetical protein